MMPAMFSGVSGLKNHQFRLNVIGNNLANVNTLGYKYSRVTFADAVYQKIQDASAPENGKGGTNPVQVGLGAVVASTDKIVTQGNLETTGRSTDMAIQGEGFFVMSDGAARFYSRAGNIIMGKDGDLFNPSNGLKLQGWSSSGDGSIDTSSPINNLNIPIGESLPASPTSSVNFAGNLTADGTTSLGTVTETASFLTAAKGATLATNLKNSEGASLGLQVGDVIAISGAVNGVNMTGQSITITSTTTLTNIASAIQTALRSVADGTLTETAAVQADGSILVTADGAHAITQLKLGLSGRSVFNNAFLYSPAIGVSGTANSNTLRAPAGGSDTLVNLFNSTGVSLGLAANDDVTLLSAVSKGTALSDDVLLANITTSTTLAELRDSLQTALFSSFPESGESVTIESNGALRISGAAGKNNAVTSVDLGAGVDAGDDDRSIFGSSTVFTQSQAAKDATTHKTALIAYDSLGVGHSLKFTFTKTSSSAWEWVAEEGTTDVGTGVVTFSSLGKILSSTGTISLTLTNGADTPLDITPDFSLISQFSGNSSVAAQSQDGYSTATLTNFSIDPSGKILGIYTNGKNKVLGQLSIATFLNAAGLNSEGRNLLGESNNSGSAIIGQPGIDGKGTLVSGSLEMSNVDVAREFTDMIITQRGFQANSRVITTSDSLLEELVNLKRG